MLSVRVLRSFAYAFASFSLVLLMKVLLIKKRVFDKLEYNNTKTKF